MSKEDKKKTQKPQSNNQNQGGKPQVQPKVAKKHPQLFVTEVTGVYSFKFLSTQPKLNITLSANNHQAWQKKNSSVSKSSQDLPSKFDIFG